MPPWRSPATRSQVAWPVTASRTRARPAGMSKRSRSKRSTSAWRLSGGVVISGSARRERSAHALPHTGGLLVALHLDGEAGDDLVPAAACVVDRDDLGARAHARAGRDGRRKAHLVPAVVDAERKSLRLDEVLAEAVDHRQRQVPVGHRGAERALA